MDKTSLLIIIKADLPTAVKIMTIFRNFFLTIEYESGIITENVR